MRDVALEDVELARAIAPVFGEFIDSTAKGESGKRACKRSRSCARCTGSRVVSKAGPWIERLEAIAVARELVAVAGRRDAAGVTTSSVRHPDLAARR
jgi:hypothetical protein